VLLEAKDPDEKMTTSRRTSDVSDRVTLAIFADAKQQVMMIMMIMIMLTMRMNIKVMMMMMIIIIIIIMIMMLNMMMKVVTMLTTRMISRCF
jgi:hypothetical protein